MADFYQLLPAGSGPPIPSVTVSCPCPSFQASLISVLAFVLSAVVVRNRQTLDNWLSGWVLWLVDLIAKLVVVGELPVLDPVAENKIGLACLGKSAFVFAAAGTSSGSWGTSSALFG